MRKKYNDHFGDLSLIDITYARPNDDCAILELVTVGYVDGAPETQRDLLDKLEGYLKHIQSDEFKKDYPQSNIFIIISFEEVPHVLITDLLFKCTKWCEDNGATLKIRIGEDYVHFTE